MKFLQVFFTACAVAGGLWLLWQLSELLRERLRMRPKKVPDAWPLARRAVLNSQERQLYASMRQAFPQYEVMIKLPLTRFTQLRATNDARFWYELLTPLSVTFTLCDHQTQPFAALDVLSDERAASSAVKLKKRALAAAQVRYVPVNAKQLPNARQLRDLLLSEKEQRDSLWKTSSGIPSAITGSSTATGTSKPSPALATARADVQAVDIPITAGPMTAGPITAGPITAGPTSKLDIELGERRAQLQRQVQEQRLSRKAGQEVRSSFEKVPQVAPSKDAKRDVRDMRDLRDLRNFHQQQDIKSRIIKPNQYNPATIFGRDSFLAPDSRRLKDDQFVDGQVTTYTTQNNLSAEHVWLHSEPTDESPSKPLQDEVKKK